MAKQDFKVDGGLVVSEGITVTGGTVDFSGATGGGQSLYDLSNVNSSSSPTNGQSLVWDSTNSYWSPSTISGGGGGGGISLSDLSVTQASASGTGTLAYNNVSGVFTYTPPDLSGYAALTDISVTTATGSGSGALTYNNATGVFTFTPPNLSTYLTTSSDTDDLSEGSSNLYFTDERVDDRVNGLLTAGSNVTLTYDDAAGTLTIASTGSGGGGGIALTDLSAANASASGGGSLAYNNANGVFTFTPPSLSGYATTASLSTVATSGAYSDLTGTPTLAAVATSGAYSDLSGTPTALSNTDSLTEGSTNLYFTNARATSAITGSDLDMGGNKVLFANLYSAESDLPSASTYHGMFAHVHGTGKGYFAHGGAWRKLLDESSSTTSNLTEGTNLYYTDARVDARLSGGSVATVTTSGNVTVGGNLTVSGTTTTVNTETINLADNTITLNSNYTGSSPTEDGGIEIERGTLANKTLVWDETNDKWTVGSETFVAGTFEGNLTGNVTGTVSSLSNHDTNDVSEGSSNLYYTDARARAAISATTASAGTTALSYNSSTGAFTLTPPDLSSYLTSASLSGYATTASLATVATSGAYSDLSGTPSLSGYLTDITGESLSDLSNVASTTPTDGQVLTYDTTNGWQPETPSSGGSTINWIASNVTSSATAAGNGALALGGSTTTSTESLAVGNYAVASGSESVAIGSSNSNTTHLKTNATSAYAIALGHRAQAVGQNAITIGWQAEAGTSTKAYSVAIGSQAISQYEKSVAIGYNSVTTADRQLMLGATTTNGFTSIRVGNTSYTPTDNLDLATKAYVDSASGGGGGTDYLAAEGTNTTAATATGTSAIAGGYEADAGGNYSVSLGYQANAGSTSAISIGYDSNAATGNQTIAIGQSTDATGTYAIAHGLLANAAHNYSAAIGYYATTGQANQLMLGRNSTTNGFTSIRVGNASYTPTNNMDLATKAYVDANAGGSLPSNIAVTGSGTATASATGTIAIGNSALVGGNTYGIAIGESAQALDTGAVAIGQSTSVNGGAYGISIGYSSVSTGQQGPVAIGYLSYAGAYSTAVGNGYSSNAGNRCWAGYYGVSVGYQASGQASYTTSVGAFSGATSAGLRGTSVGYDTSVAGSNGTALGNGALAYANQFVLGNSSVNDLRCQDTSITGVSDSRDKTNITSLTLGLDFVNAIEPKAFNKNNRNEYYTEAYTPEQLEEDDSLTQSHTFDQAAYEAGTEKFSKREFGFIAQDVAAQLPDEYSDARLTFSETEDKYGFDVQRFTMGDMTPILWKALRELSDKHDQLQSDYDALLARVVALENA